MSDRIYYSEGSDAFYFGHAQTDCPYPEGGRAWLLWADGWEEARHDAERKQALRSSFRMPVPMFGVRAASTKRSN